MASWPARFISNSLGSNSSLPAQAPTTPTPSVRRQANSGQESSTVQPLHDVPILQPSPRKGTKHGRSVSHPFPSFFNPGKKIGSRGHAHDAFGPDSTDDESIVTSSGALSSASTKFGQGNARQGGSDKDLIAGKCMTCDSLVRWPKELNVFRCTICLTINDLKPYTATGSADTRPPVTVLPISLQKTQAIIDRCLTSYLEAKYAVYGSHKIQPMGPQHGLPKAREGIDADNGPPRVRGRDTTPAYLISPPQVDGGRPLDTTSSARYPAAYSRSSPDRDPSPLDQVHRAGFKGSVPSAPTRPPPPVPRGTEAGLPPTHYARSQTTETTMSGGHNFSNQGRTGDDGDEGYSYGDESIFRPLERYILTCFASWECVNSSFIVDRPVLPVRAASEGTREGWKSIKGASKHHAAPMSGLDAKTLLLGDFAENGSWWTGSQSHARRTGGSSHRRDRSADCADGNRGRGIVSAKASCVDWAEISKWYELLLSVGKDWRSKWQEIEGIHSSADKGRVQGDVSTGGERIDVVRDTQHIGNEISDARWRVHRVLLKATEDLLKRPGRPLNNPQDIHFILVILANPLLYPSSLPRTQPSPSPRERESSVSQRKLAVPKGNPQHSRKSPMTLGPGLHTGIIKRILGLLSNLPNECHHGLVSWFSQLSTNHFRRIVELVGSFVTHRLNRQHATKRSDNADPTSGLVPNLTGPGVGSHAHLHAALGISGSSKSSESKQNLMYYGDDWQIRAAARVMALLFSANNSSNRRKTNWNMTRALDAEITNSASTTRHQIIPTSDFYNTPLDYSDLIADFEAWESRRGKFSFCQYPFFLSIWAKIHIMEYDARRQMEVKAREAFFDSIMNRRAISQYLVLKVRRDCLVEDSLRGVSEVVGSGQEDIKKGLRIEFLGEEGVDAGGLRKEWFLLLVRDIFDPDHGMFVFDEDSHHCYFNPNSFETSDQFFLVGVLLGLAIYNSTILDVALPPFAFKKLLASAPSLSGLTTFSSRPTPGYTLGDLGELRPSLANGLRQLLEFDGNVEEVFCRDFVAEVDRYGQVVQIPLCPGGETRSVTNANRREFVDLYIHYLLETSVARQYEPFKRGFYTVCGGNALSLFRPEEIELLVRGSDEPLDISSLRAVALYENWGIVSPGDTEPLIGWFWQFFETADPRDQRKILGFITGSDRIPAMGATSLVIKIVCLGEDCERYPVARTCFNALCMWRYGTREKLEKKLWTAVTESEGFGLK
ncbi:hypothetical protein GP486_000690 [Trichoglossum hirsutum]|uniref:HECT-type E3 ubiquitin transferase n=1 Tax=Trichoglossum hirsutum TaxID=265104 RepID=A0A9P8LIA8_9PEZI|nr:hypothetical protein GP486_000690 [Trichoglossum hirsutum]